MTNKTTLQKACDKVDRSRSQRDSSFNQDVVEWVQEATKRIEELHNIAHEALRTADNAHMQLKPIGGN